MHPCRDDKSRVSVRLLGVSSLHASDGVFPHGYCGLCYPHKRCGAVIDHCWWVDISNRVRGRILVCINSYDIHSFFFWYVICKPVVECVLSVFIYVTPINDLFLCKLCRQRCLWWPVRGHHNEHQHSCVVFNRIDRVLVPIRRDSKWYDEQRLVGCLWFCPDTRQRFDFLRGYGDCISFCHQCQQLNPDWKWPQ
jgi:hypothetical protein